MLASFRRRPATWLRRILLTNATFSAMCTALCLTLGDRIAGWTGIPAAEVKTLGIELAVFAGVVAWVATRDFDRAWARTLAALVAVGDSLWVLGSLAVSAGVPAGILPDLTTAGRLVILAQALVVADFAFGQFYCWWRLRRRDETSAQVARAADAAA